MLEACGLGTNFRAYVSLLYSNIFSIFKINNELVSPIQVQRGVRQGCPVSGLLFSLVIEPLLILFRKNLSGVTVSTGIPSIVVSAYADDVAVVIKNDNDISAFVKCLNLFCLASSLNCNWNKSKALWVPSLKNNPLGTRLVPPVHLPSKLKWVEEGVKYLGVFLGSPFYVLKNWDGMVEHVKKRLGLWKRALPHLSYRARVLVVNNLVASSLWHKFICLQPPEVLLKAVQRLLVDFFWSGFHWLQPNVICRPLAEGGQGLVDIKSRIMAFRLCSTQMLMHEKQLLSRLLARHILQQASGLGYSLELFLIKLQHVDISHLSTFYQSLLNAWQSLSVSRQQETYATNMFVEEPLFYNPLFPAIPRSRDLYQHFIAAGIIKILHLRHDSGLGWKSVPEIADMTRIWSNRTIGKILREIVKKSSQLELKWTQERLLTTNDLRFPGLIVQPSQRDLPPISSGKNIFQKYSSKDQYRLSTRVLLEDSPLNGVARWKRLMPEGLPSEPIWNSFYSKLVAKMTGDLQWRLAHWVIPSNKLLSNFSPISGCCPFCICTEDLFHAYVDCTRLVPLFQWLNHMAKKMQNYLLTKIVYFRVERTSKLIIFVLSSHSKNGELFIEEREIERNVNCDVQCYVFFNALITARLKLEFCFSKSEKSVDDFKKSWCHEGICKVHENYLLISL